jgi:hypothetical protein
VGAVVAGATDQLADDTRTLTQGLGKGVSGINPALGGIVGKAGEVLADVLEGTGKGLGVALGHRR